MTLLPGESDLRVRHGLDMVAVAVTVPMICYCLSESVAPVKFGFTFVVNQLGTPAGEPRLSLHWRHWG
jgi:hypothetical protein